MGIPDMKDFDNPKVRIMRFQESEGKDWRRPLNCPKCNGTKTFSEGFCSNCGYDVA